MTDHCETCQGLICEPNKAYLYAGKVCNCASPIRGQESQPFGLKRRDNCPACGRPHSVADKIENLLNNPGADAEYLRGLREALKIVRGL